MADSMAGRKEAPPGDRPSAPASTVGAPAGPRPDLLDLAAPWRPETLGYDVYSRLCPTRLVLDRIADKWSMLVLARLRRGPRRFNALRREVDGVSQKVLSQTLKALERDGLVRRTAFPTVPVTVEYAATPLGMTLGEVVAAVGRWAEANIEEVVAAQRLFDASSGRAAPQASRATT
jgi:DNA-binding HxlR family transcriptional regulator